jgi:hypothetical protein
LAATVAYVKIELEEVESSVTTLIIEPSDHSFLIKKMHCT